MICFRGCFSVRVSTCLFIFTLCGRIIGALNEPVKVTVMEEDDAILPCSLSTKENIEFELFDWRKDGQKEVFLYDEQDVYSNGRYGQDEQFKGRVSHFQDELKRGNASIIIRKTKVADSGNYTCDFPRLQPSQTFHIQLVVEPVKVTVMEEDDVILPCSLSTKEDIEFKVFDWKKDGQREVFMYDAGIHYNNNPSDAQDRQFRGRVFHFRDELKDGNASIIIRKMTLADSGNYTCDFPRLQPSQTFHIELVVDGIFKDRRLVNVPGSASEPSVKILNQTKDGSLLQCVVRRVSPKPEVEWKDGSGNIVPAEEPKITERGGSYDIILQTTVTKMDHYRCVVTQKEIYHQVDSQIFVHISEKIIQGTLTGLIAAVVVLSILLNVVVVFVLLRERSKKGCWWHENSSEERPAYDHKQGNGLRTDPLLPGSDVPEKTSPV